MQEAGQSRAAAAKRRHGRPTAAAKVRGMPRLGVARCAAEMATSPPGPGAAAAARRRRSAD
eukprot:11201004-Lingulodinium_polyedra.AAC.1